ncbi:MmgE/PrpD family protein [Knoellia sp. CPCC 206435]|uniref:MmgE/PrpD family protein n=1 Tax=Knoellia terrae TaxID=3404797 RepID=UPI003B42D6EB
MTGTAVARLGTFAADVAGDPPEHVLVDARQRLLDVVGISVAALGTGPAQVAHSLASRWGGAAVAVAIGLDDRLPAPSAALVNGTLAHALDFDDTHVPSILHPSASVVPAALAAAEEARVDGRTLLAAIAVGNEIAIRLGNAGYDPRINNSIFFERGLHATSICGAVGAAAAAGVAMGLDAERLAHAMAIACSMGAGLLEANRAGGSVKRMHCGWAAHSGVVAAQAAGAGLTGPPTVLEGRFGFYQAYCGDTYDEAALLDGLGVRWETASCFVKPYPTNVFTHTGIDAAIALRERGLRPADVESVRIGVAGATLRTIAQPREAKIRPESGYHAQFSGPFTFALALRGGGGLGLYLDDFTDEAVRDPRNLDLAARVEHVADARCERIFPLQFPSIVEVRTTDGRVLVHEVLANRGTVERPLTDAEVQVKYDLNARRLGAGADVLARRITGLLDATSVAGLLTL